jgi:branched-chain amino acid transport system ATP-binding protein
MGAYTVDDAGRVAAAMDRVYALFPILRERQKQSAGTLSGGEQQMLAIARGLMVGPSLLVLDEPSLGLSPKFVGLVFEKILEMKAGGLTMLVVEQNAAKALSVADRAYVLELGKNRFEGPGRDLLNNPEVKRLYLGG